MRLFLTGVIFTLFSICSVPLYGVAWLLGKKDERLQVAFSQNVIKVVFRMIYFVAGVRLVCEGREQLDKKQAYMYIANHKSNLDILTAYLTVPTLTAFVSKDSLKHVPVIRIWMKFLKCLFLNRKDPRDGLKMILQGVEQLKQGYSIFIMPEGTRNRTEELLPFHEGSFKLATKSECPIVPIAMKNNDKIVGHHLAFFRPITVKVVFGQPVYLSDLEPEDKKHIGAYMRERMKEMLANID